MPFIHFDEAKTAATTIVRTWVDTSPAARTLVIVDLFGKIRIVTWGGGIEDPNTLSSLREKCGPWWTEDVLRGDDLDGVAAQTYNDAWESARPDEQNAKLRVLNRHRSRTAWFSGPVEPVWSAPEEGAPVVAFYSFKGGLGRSTVLASFAIQRARAGERVCVIDFDLDSPGVGRVLSADAQGHTAQWGVVDYLLEHGLEGAPLGDYFHRCDRVAGDGEIVVFPAGSLDEEYAEKLARANLEEDMGLRNLLARVRSELKPNWLLLDARTGISELAGPILSGMAHLHVLMGTTHEQSWQGLNRVLERLGKERVLADLPQAEVLLVQAMVPAGEPGKAARIAFAARAEQAFDELYFATDEEEGDDAFWALGDKGSSDAPHTPLSLDYDARLASFGDIVEVATDVLADSTYRSVAERITSRFLQEPVE